MMSALKLILVFGAIAYLIPCILSQHPITDGDRLSWMRRRRRTSIGQQIWKQPSESRMFGELVGWIIGNIDWLPIEINVVDVVLEMIKWFMSMGAAISSTSTG